MSALEQTVSAALAPVVAAAQTAVQQAEKQLTQATQQLEEQAVLREQNARTNTEAALDTNRASRAAEAAYGDLFALERRLGGDAVTLWRAYLRQFPRGRYADDARAGVCRREPAADRGQCWTEYLAAHPDGAHRREAEQASRAP